MAEEKKKSQPQQQPRQAQPAPQQSGGNTSKGILIGCGIGCAVLLVIVLIIVLFSWCSIAKWGTGWKNFDTPSNDLNSAAMDAAANEAIQNAQ